MSLSTQIKERMQHKKHYNNNFEMCRKNAKKYLKKNFICYICLFNAILDSLQKKTVTPIRNEFS